MSHKKFTVWLEDRQANEIRDAVVSKIRADMGIDDEDEISQMKTADLSSDAQEQILKLGPVMDKVNPAQVDQIKDFMSKPDTTVGTLIDRINTANIETPAAPPLETNPAVLPQQSQNLGQGI